MKSVLKNVKIYRNYNRYHQKKNNNNKLVTHIKTY